MQFRWLHRWRSEKGLEQIEQVNLSLKTNTSDFGPMTASNLGLVLMDLMEEVS